MKALSGGPGGGLPITDREGGCVGELSVLTPTFAADRSIVETIVRWRNEHRAKFMSQFVPTVERQLAWYRDDVLPDPARVLFLARDRSGRLVGQYGFKRINAHDAEVDQVIRGERSEVPRFFEAVSLAVMRFGFETLGLERLWLQVLSNNDRAIGLYRRTGFHVEARAPLVRDDVNGDVTYRLAKEGETDLAPFEILTMAVERSTFDSIRTEA
jgi:RimJ/RimL family protein N-acetyltransferase